jgi:iron complex outermembrane receptor protein
MLPNILSRLSGVAIFSVLLCSISLAQTVQGVVLDADTREPLAGANVVVTATQQGIATGFDGSFNLKVNRNEELRISFVGYETQTIAATDNMQILLAPSARLEQMIIEAVRAEPTDPVTQSTISRREIQREYNGEQPIYYLEQLSPSIFSFSESGTKLVNGGQMRLRGISQERINFTLNGVPLNDMIDHGVFFSNFTDIGGSFESVQVQRGVGTSANGTASYAGSVNFESVNLEEREQGAVLEAGGGAFNTFRLNSQVSSGMIDDRWSFFGNFSKIQSDGFRDNTSTDAYSFFFSGGYFGEKDLVKINAFDARSKNGLGYSAVAESDLEVNRRLNYLNENDKDDFGQRFVQVQYTRLVNEAYSMTSSLYYGGASGDYFYTYPDVNGLAQINYPLRNDHYGFMANVHFDNKALSWSTGIHTHRFDRRNEESITPDFANPYYLERSQKNEFSWFGKAAYITGAFELQADVQIRTMNLQIEPDYTFIGIAPEGDIAKEWTFVNPRIGVTYTLNNHIALYSMVGRTGREPTKIDIFGGFSLGAANYAEARSDGFNPEYVNNLEAGIKGNYQKLAFSANVFYMDFKDEIAPIGEVLAFGVQKRENIAESYRAGVELAYTFIPQKQVTLRGNLAFMKAEIDAFETGDGTLIEGVTPILSPEWIINQAAAVQLTEQLAINLSVNYVSESYLELSNNPAFKLPSQFVLNSFIAWQVQPVTVRLELNNLTDAVNYSSGAPVDVDFDGTNDEPGYFVNAGRNLFLTLRLEL